MFFEKKNCIWKLNFEKQFLFLRKKKTYLVELIKKLFRINKTKHV